ncbi:Protein kinase-like (PK-like) [Glarea lozoyensis ATCC 20868]|uniref:protein-ribulosamine 3-kinase n=1 Tax=Glarea lozoyensis (strain ATCC 20868 / MF5171) TaxID=1116229 RepID=S3EBL8_GLAL2|nr:Protein kinase-like (PK-like) [Glarea lozoyensis ATCC 20868]EPE35698.1 Protein kinase-like (PK-like) [Glarea lozoyensis ATCC 20868]
MAITDEDSTAVSTTAILAGLNGKFPIDDAVIEALPPGLSFVSVEAYGNSAWTLTGKITTQRPDGSEKLFFLKAAFGEHGGVILKGESESADIIYGLMPDFIPRPYAYGKYKTTNPITYFFLTDFIDMDVTTAPDPMELATKLAQLHKKGRKPGGKYGFHVTTCDGKMPNTIAWQDTWATFYGNLLQGICNVDLETNGSWPELERATKQVITKVIPILLGNLKHEGEPIEPCILHGDLWDSNLGTNMATGEVVMYDVGSYYGHNEMDLGQWRADFCTHLRSNIYTRHYLKNYPAADPVEQFDDRNRLYSMKGTMNYSAGHPGSIVRQTVYNNMCYLCEKYAPIDGIDKYDAQKDPSVTGAQLTPDFTKRD